MSAASSAPIVDSVTEERNPGDELALIERIADRTPRLLYVLNKADRVGEGDRQEATRCTERVLEEKVGRSNGAIFNVSALGVRRHGEQRYGCANGSSGWSAGARGSTPCVSDDARAFERNDAAIHERFEFRQDAVDAILRIHDLDHDRQTLREDLDHVRVHVPIVPVSRHAFHDGGTGHPLLAEELDDPHEHRRVIEASRFAEDQPEQYLFAFDAAHVRPPSSSAPCPG
jgi:hypothetical protein